MELKKKAGANTPELQRGAAFHPFQICVVDGPIFINQGDEEFFEAGRRQRKQG
jgi:hypothetical protein